MRFANALRSLGKAEEAAAQQKRQLTQGERDAFWRKLSNQRNHVLYLISCMGDFIVPVGAPLLSEIAVKDTGAEKVPFVFELV